MKKLVVLLDVDGVIANFRKLFADCCNEVNGTDFTPEDTGNEWSFIKSLGISTKQNNLTWDNICLPGRASNMELLPGAFAGVKALSASPRVDLYFVTSPVPTSPTWTYDRRHWIHKNFGGTLSNKILFTNQKHLVRGNIFVDDKREAVIGWKEAFPEDAHTGIIWAPASIDTLPTNLYQVNNWNGLHAICNVMWEQLNYL